MEYIDNDGDRFKLWLQSEEGKWWKFELNDTNDEDCTVGFEMWSHDNQCFKLSFVSTSKFIEWCELLKRLGEAKLADDAQKARVVSIADKPNQQ